MSYDDDQQRDERASGERDPAHPAEDPKDRTAPPSTPDVDQDDVERGREKIDRIVGN